MQSLDEVAEVKAPEDSVHNLSWNRKRDNSVMLSSSVSVSNWTVTDSDAKVRVLDIIALKSYNYHHYRW